MTTPKTPEERAGQYLTKEWSHVLTANKLIGKVGKDCHLAGRLSFIENELPELLEMAREKNTPYHYCHTIKELIAKAKGEK